jgi:hypothetical protein
MEAAMKLDRNDRPFYFFRTASRASASVPIPSRAWVKSAQPPSASNDEWNWDNWAQSPHNVSAPSAAADSAARIESGRDRRRETHRPAPLDCNVSDERLGLFLAGALLAVIAWGALGAAPRGAAVIVTMFAAAFIGAALASSFGPWRKPGVGRVIDVMPARGPRHADAARPGKWELQRARAAVDAARPVASAHEARTSLGTSRRPRGRSAYAGLADE